MTQSPDNNTVQPENSNIIFTHTPVSSVITVSGDGGSPLFSIKPNGEFIPGPGLELSDSISEAAKTFYKNMTIFGRTFSQMIDQKDEKIKELEKQLEQLKNGTSN